MTDHSVEVHASTAVYDIPIAFLVSGGLMSLVLGIAGAYGAQVPAYIGAMVALGGGVVVGMLILRQAKRLN